MNVRRVLALVLFASFSGTAYAGGPWYVDANAPPPGLGTLSAPYTSLQYAIAQPAVQFPDTILVLPGTYLETIDYLGKELTIRSTGGPSVTTIEAVPGSSAAVTIGPGDPRLEGFTVQRAAAGPGEAGIFVKHGTEAFLVRCIVRGHDLGILNNYDTFADECTITQNRIGIFAPMGGTSEQVTSSIVHGNAEWDIRNVGGFALLYYSDIGSNSGAVSGASIGNFAADPKFWDAPGGDLHLRADSPCIDTGDPASPLDPDGSRIDVGALTFDPAHAPGTGRYCFGESALCPCGNGGSGLGGCDIAQATGGIALAVQNFLPNGTGGGTVELVGTGYPPTSSPGVTLIRSTAAETPPVVFGDGLRCIGTAGFVRVNATLASGGTSLNPAMHGAGAGGFYYQVWVRNQPAMFCTAEAFNLSNGVSIDW